MRRFGEGPVNVGSCHLSQTRPLISTFPSSVNCLRAAFARRCSRTGSAGGSRDLDNAGACPGRAVALSLSRRPNRSPEPQWIFPHLRSEIRDRRTPHLHRPFVIVGLIPTSGGIPFDRGQSIGRWLSRKLAHRAWLRPLGQTHDLSPEPSRQTAKDAPRTATRRDRRGRAPC